MIVARTPLFLMANLGSEVSRMFSASERGERLMAEKSEERALRILLQIKSFPEMKQRRAELDILESAISDCLKEDRDFKIHSADLENYFLPFAMRIMK